MGAMELRRLGRGGVFRRLRGRRGGRVSFRYWARCLAGRLAAALVFAAALPVFTVSLGAQGQPLGVCMRTAPAAAAFASGGDLAPDGEPGDGGFIPPTSLVRAAVGCAEAFAAATMVPIGLNIWAGLAIIITIWTGIQIMFSGSFGIGEIVSLILLLGFPFAVLTFYNTGVGTPWGDMTFPHMVSGMGQVVSADLVDGVFMTFRNTFMDVWEKIWTAQTMAVTGAASEVGEAEGLWATVVAAFGRAVDLVQAFNPFTVVRTLFRNIIFFLVVVLLILVLVIPALVAYCSYLWGYLSLLVAIILGPLLIPWILVPQMQFLAWGWFRTLLGAGVHMMVAGACFAVVAQILMIPLIRFGDLMTQHATEPSVGTFLATSSPGIVVLVESMPLIVVAFLGAFKIGEITSMIMNGGSMPSSGIGDRMRSAQGIGRMGRSAASLGRGAAGMMSGGGAVAGRAAVAATGAGAAVVAASAVMSQATKKS